MSTTTTLVFSAYLAQAAGAALLSIVFLVLFRFYRQRHLMDWTLSLWAASIAFSSAAVALAIMREFPSHMHPARILAANLSVVAGYLQLVWLLAGAYGSTGLRHPSRSVVRTALWLAPVLAVALGVFFSLTLGMPEVPMLVRLALAGAAYVVAAGWVLSRWAEDRCIGRAVTASALGLLGIVSFHNAAAHLIVGLLGGQPPYLAYVPYGSMLLQYLLGLGVLMWLLEAERARALKTSQQVERLAFYDPTTGLPNRDLLVLRLSEVLARARTEGVRPALLALALDRFKAINESLGYARGDALLVAATHRLRAQLGPGDTLARLSGSELAVLLPGCKTEEEARAFADRLAVGLRSPLVILGQEQRATINVGIAVFPEGGPDVQALLKSAGVALNLAEETGGGAVEMFTQAVKLKARERTSHEASLRRAIDAGEFVLFYQPIVAAATGAVVGAEALLRWRKPDRGVVGPSEFLPSLEAYGLSEALDPWILETACREACRWHDLLGRPLYVAVNLSARPFQSPNLVGRISSVLAETRLDPACLELEITETLAMQDPQASREVLLALKKLGVRAAIDDFGTGYSSLGTLHSLPVDTLKMDYAFVRSLDVDPKSAAIADSIVLLAHGLGLQVVAEGVETVRQRAAVVRHRCDLMQGFLLGYPLPSDQFDHHLVEHSGEAESHRVS